MRELQAVRRLNLELDRRFHETVTPVEDFVVFLCKPGLCIDASIALC